MSTPHHRQSRMEEIARLAPWFHNLHLPDGTETAPDHPLGDFPASKWRQVAAHVPRDLRGWRALDIGCNAGFYSFELARRGARVLAIDHDGHYLAQARWAAEMLDPGGRVTFARRSVYALAPASTRYDLVLFLGVLHQLRYPLLVLDTLSRLEPRLLIVQTLTAPDPDDDEIRPQPLDFAPRALLNAPGRPRMAFIEAGFAGDPANWWAPNRACVRAMLRSAGFIPLAETNGEIFICAGERPRRARHHDHHWDAVTHGAPCAVSNTAWKEEQ